MAQKIAPLDVVELFPLMRAELLRILYSLNDAQWASPTACGGWSVKDVASHILSDDLGYLSRHRDKDGITFVAKSFDELVELINQQNETWVQATRRISHRMLLTLLETTGEELHDYLRTIDPYEGTHPVSWAGNQEAPMWLQIARELTEYWMHHQHISEAVGIQSLKERQFLHPVLSTFVHALPRTYAHTDAPEGTVIELRVMGEAGDSWFIQREGDLWRLYADSEIPPTSIITLSDDTAWRIFTKGIAPDEARSRVHIDGDQTLGEIMLNTVAILA